MKVATWMLTVLLAASTPAIVQSSDIDGPASPSASMSQEAANKMLVERLYREFFNGRDLSVPEQIVAENYIQHNPSLPDGRAILIRAFAAYFQAAPELRVSVKRMVAEGNLVVVHSHWQDRPTDRGNAVVDVYRIENGLIAEHWDVLQPVPETAANTNGMF
jgi:predicted SnoaL-like aldol condensation-catalyzing enzyme